MSQKALLLPKAKEPSFVGTRPIPRPGPGELLVRIQAAALNPVDWKVNYDYSFLLSEFPAVNGSDSAGIVEEIGEGVTGFAKGDAVFHQGFFKNDRATFQQYTLVPADLAAKKPSSISFDEAASIPLGVATAAQGLYGDRKSPDILRFTPPWEEGGEHAAEGKFIVILGGSSSVGQYAIQLAKLSGFSSIITTASPHNASQLEALGATAVIDRRSLDVRNEIKKAAKGSPIEFVYDAISDEDTESVGLDVLAPNGTLAIVLAPLKVDLSEHADKRVVDDIAGNVNLPHLRALGVSLYKALPKLLEAGKLKPNRVEVLPGGLHGIPDGLARLQANKVSGVKLIARPQETS